MGLIVYSRLGAICRVFPANAPADPAYRKTVIATVAKELSKDYSCLYWIDGPDASELAAELKRQAPDLAVAAPQNGDMDTLTAVPAAKPAKPYLLVNVFPSPPTGCNYVLGDKDEDFARLDTAMADPRRVAAVDTRQHGALLPGAARGLDRPVQRPQSRWLDHRGRE